MERSANQYNHQNRQGFQRNQYNFQNKTFNQNNTQFRQRTNESYMHTNYSQNYQNCNFSKVDNKENWDVSKVGNEESWDLPKVDNEENWDLPKEDNQENWDLPNVDHEENWYVPKIDNKAARPSFDEFDDVTEPLLPYVEILPEFNTVKTIRKSKLHENPVNLFFMHDQIFISISEMIKLTKLKNSSVRRIKEELLELNCSESLREVKIEEKELNIDGMKNENNRIDLISVEFIPEFFKIFTDIVFPHALFQKFLNEIYAWL